MKNRRYDGGDEKGYGFLQKVRFGFALAIGVVSALPASADVLGTRDAQAVLFSTRDAVLAVNQSLSDRDRSTLEALLPIMEERLTVSVGYYGAFAFSPSDGLVSDSLQGALNYHSLPAARSAAIAACEATKSSAAEACVIAGELRPRRYEDRAFTLSQDATKDFNSGYARARGPKVFAISPSTGFWGWDSSADAALEQCASKGGADCKIAVQDN